MVYRVTILLAAALLGCSSPDLPAGWEDAVRIEGLTQKECKGSSLDANAGETLVVGAKAGAVSIAYDAAHFRCAQDVEGFERTEASKLMVLVQPIDMNPSEVAGCDCLYDIGMTIDGLERGKTSVELYRRWDNLNTPNDPKLVGSTQVDVQ